jgi:methyltransferase OMS1
MAWKWVGAYVGGVGCLYMYTSMTRKQASSPAAAAAAGAAAPAVRVDPAEGYKIFDARATEYDGAVGTTETLWGMSLMRRFLLGHAAGDVLEVCAGTGRNVDYYSARAVSRVVMADRSASVLRVASGKVPARSRVRFETAVMDACALDAPDGAFDTVIDTFGMCSTPDPGRMLSEVRWGLLPRPPCGYRNSSCACIITRRGARAHRWRACANPAAKYW